NAPEDERTVAQSDDPASRLRDVTVLAGKPSWVVNRANESGSYRQRPLNVGHQTLPSLSTTGSRTQPCPVKPSAAVKLTKLFPSKRASRPLDRPNHMTPSGPAAAPQTLASGSPSRTVNRMKFVPSYRRTPPWPCSQRRPAWSR